MDDVIDQTGPGYMELARRLEAYADWRLSPSATATARMRTVVMNAAHLQAALIQAGATLDVAPASSAIVAPGRVRAAWTRDVPWRRPVVAMVGVALTFAILAGSAYGAKAGGPLYAVRIWAEMVNLPANLVARAQAEGDRLEARLREAQEASTAGDAGGTEAALAAYSTIVVEAVLGSAGDPTASAALEVTVTRQVGVLTLLIGSVPSEAEVAVEHALSSSTKALDDLEAGGTPTSDDQHATDRSHGEGPIQTMDGATDPAAKDPAVSDPAPTDPVHKDPSDVLRAAGPGPREAPVAAPKATDPPARGGAPKPSGHDVPVQTSGHDSADRQDSQ
jgi:hypothetical protein